MQRRIRILHLPLNVGGNAQGISLHLKALGLQSENWAVYQNYLGYEADKTIAMSHDSKVAIEMKRLFALRYVFLFDVIFFNFGQTLFPQFPANYFRGRSVTLRTAFKVYRVYSALMQRIELGLLRILRRKIFIQYQGDDARQGEFSLKHFSVSIATQVSNEYYSPESDELKREQIRRLTSISHKVYALNPDLLHVLPTGSQFLPYCHISLHEWAPFYTQMEKRPLRIGHAPSNRKVKGTDIILLACQELKRLGYAFELVLIEGMSNSEAKECYKGIDVLVDQLFAGWYGGLAVEAMALGKPVIAYIREEDLGHIPKEMASDLPVIRSAPTHIQEVIQEVLEMKREDLLLLGRRSRDYVMRWHNPFQIAGRLKQDIESAFSLN